MLGLEREHLMSMPLELIGVELIEMLVASNTTLEPFDTPSAARQFCSALV